MINKSLIRTTILTFGVIITGCSNENAFKITGRVNDLDQGYIYLDKQEVSEVIPVDSARIHNDGSFKLKGQTEYPGFFNLHMGDKKIIPLLIDHGDKINITCNSGKFTHNYIIHGSEGSQYLKELSERLSVTRRKIDSLQQYLHTHPGTGQDELAKIQEEYLNIIEDQHRYSLEFVLNHRTSMAALYALYQKIDDETFVFYKNRDIQIMKITGQALDTIYPESSHVKALVANAANLEQQIQNFRLNSVMDNAKTGLPEIALPDPNGDTIRISSLSGKVILLSFWASWDNASMDFNPKLLPVYRKYHSAGFEIYQVSLDNNLQTWKRAIQFDELPWISVCDLSFPNSVVAGVYNITKLPITFLISKEGDIVGKNFSINELDNKIGELLNN